MQRSNPSLPLILSLLLLPVAANATQGAAANAAADMARAQAEAARTAARQSERAAELSREHAELQREHEEMQRDMEEDAEPASESEALAMEALEGLIAAPPQRALPLVRKVLAGSQSERVKRRALFVLGMIDLPEAGQLLAETAQKATGGMQREAIRALGIRGGKGQSETLQAIYRNGDARARRAVVEAFVISGDKAALFAVAKSAAEPKEARAAIEALAAIGAVAELRELGQGGKLSAELMQAYAIAGDLEGLLKIAKSDADPRLRSEATRSIGIVGGDKGRQALRELYRTAADDDQRSAALEGMMISGDEQGVLALYRAATDAARKRELLRMLSVMGGDAALEAIDAALQGQTP